MNHDKIEISWGTLWKIAIMVAIAAILFLVRDILVDIFLAIVISSGLSPLVDWLEKKGLPRVLGTLLAYLFVLIIIGLIIYAVLPVALVELDNLLSNVVQLTGDIFRFSSTEDFISNFNNTFRQISRNFFSGDFSFLTLASNVFGGLTLVIAVLIISFYLSISKNGVEWFLRAILPEDYEDKAIAIARVAKKKIGYWLRTQIILSFLIGLIASIGLWFLGVRHAFILGLVAAVFEIVPFVGPVFAGSVAVLVALSDSVVLAIYTIALFVVIQQIEGNAIVPLVMNRAVGLHPVVVMAALMMGYQLLGFIGIIIAVPVAVILQEILDDWVSVKDSRRALKNTSD